MPGYVDPHNPVVDEDEGRCVECGGTPDTGHQRLCPLQPKDIDPQERIAELEEHIMLLTRRAATARDSVVALRKKANRLKAEVARLDEALTAAGKAAALESALHQARIEGFVDAMNLVMARLESERDQWRARCEERAEPAGDPPPPQ